MLNVITAPAAPFTARLSVHVITAAAPAASVAPIVTVNTAALLAADVTAAAVPPVVAVHVVAASAVKRLAEGVMVTVPEDANDCVGVNVTTRLPPDADGSNDDRVPLPHVTDVQHTV